MGLMDEIRKQLKPGQYSAPEEEYYDEYDDEEPMEEEQPRRSYTSNGGAAVDSNPIGRASGGRITSISPASTMQVIVVKPDRFDQAAEIAAHLLNKQAIVLNLESTNKDVARRLVDFLSGCAHALEGHIPQVAISTYLVTPYNVEVQDKDIKERDENPSYL